MVDTIKAMLSNPVDGDTKNEITALIKNILVTFTGYYVKQYALGLVKKGIDDASEEPGPDWKLMERPPREDSFKEGWVLKEGGTFSKSMQKRYFVVRPDYMIDYYNNEEEMKKGKKKGTISLCGYYVNDDANNGPLQRLTKLAEKMGVDMSNIPKPKQYPPNTMELHHERRQTFYVQVENPEEFKQWVDQMRTCAWRAWGFKNKDEVHTAAFQEAIRQTRWKLDRWGWWSYGGTEEQVLSDLIADQLDYIVMGKIYAKIQGPWSVRWMIRKQVLKLLDKMVLAAVTPAWKAMSTTVEQLRPKIEPKIKEMVGPIGEAKLKVMEKIKEACMSVIEPAIKEHVVPHLAKIIAAIQSPMRESFAESFVLFNKEGIDKFDVKETVEANKKEFRDLDYIPHSWKMWNVTQKADTMYDPLWALNIVFNEIYPWSLIWTAHDTLRSKMDNAIYTFEQKLIEAQSGEEIVDAKAIVGKLKDVVTDMYKEDAKLATSLYFIDIIKKIVMPPISKLVYPPAESLLSPISDAIPEPMQDFLDINDMFERIVEGVIEDSIKTALESA